MSESYYCDADRFAVTVDRMMERLVRDVNGVTMPTVRKACSIAKKEVKWYAKSKYQWSEDYVEGFSSTFKKKSLQSFGEVGNKSKPGLVHLLEKGHAKMGGGRTNEYPHMAPAADKAFEYFWDEMEKEVGKAL